MQRVNQNDRIILCKYDPTEPGDYNIEVKYSGKHVPGSPFAVMIFDTQDELNRYNSRQYGEIGGGGNGPNERGAEDVGLVVGGGGKQNNGLISKTNKHNNHNNNHSHHHPHHHPHHIRSAHPVIPAHLPPPTIVHSPHLPGHPHPLPPPPPPHPPVDYHGYSIYGPTSWRGSANEL